MSSSQIFPNTVKHYDFVYKGLCWTINPIDSLVHVNIKLIVISCVFVYLSIGGHAYRQQSSSSQWIKGDIRIFYSLWKQEVLIQPHHHLHSHTWKHVYNTDQKSLFLLFFVSKRVTGTAHPLWSLCWCWRWHFQWAERPTSQSWCRTSRNEATDEWFQTRGTECWRGQRDKDKTVLLKLCEPDLNMKYGRFMYYMVTFLSLLSSMGGSKAAKISFTWNREMT